MNTKTLRTIILSITLLLPIALWLTKDQYYGSMSAFADAPNEILYNAIHICIATLFLFQGHADKRNLDYQIALCAFAVLLTNMYDFYIPHLIATGMLVGAVAWSMINYSSKQHKITNVIMGILCPTIFIIGLRHQLHIFWIEYIIFLIVAIHVLRRNYINARA